MRTASIELERRLQRAAWVAEQVMPHEPAVRALLARLRVPREDCDEVIQDCYCRFAMLDAIDHIERPRAYFISMARHLVTRSKARALIVPIDVHAEMDLFIDEERPSPEQATGFRIDYERMLTFLSALPERCRMIVELRKLEGWSQKDIAAHLGVTEKVVEKQVWLGVKAIQRAWSEADFEVGARLAAFEADREAAS